MLLKSTKWIPMEWRLVCGRLLCYTVLVILTLHECTLYLRIPKCKVSICKCLIMNMGNWISGSRHINPMTSLWEEFCHMFSRWHTLLREVLREVVWKLMWWLAGIGISAFTQINPFRQIPMPASCQDIDNFCNLRCETCKYSDCGQWYCSLVRFRR